MSKLAGGKKNSPSAQAGKCQLCNKEGNISHEEQTDLRIRRTHKFLQEAMIPSSFHVA
jgi:hypothetical protein